jgi:hypothetical protein
VLNAVYEADFRGFSYGFRPRRSPHHALDASGGERKKLTRVLEATMNDDRGAGHGQSHRLGAVAPRAAAVPASATAPAPPSAVPALCAVSSP